MTPDAPGHVVILAGGRSHRLGRDKRRVVLQQGTLLESVVDAARDLGWPVFLAVSPGQEEGVRPDQVAVLRDPAFRRGPWPVVAHWLEAMQLPLLILAADLPLLRSAHVRDMVDGARTHPQAWAVAAQGTRGPEPLWTLYRPSALPHLRKASAAGERSLRRCLASHVDRGVALWHPPLPEILGSVNEREDLHQVRAAARRDLLSQETRR